MNKNIILWDNILIMALGEVPCSSYMALYIISMHIVSSNSRSSNLWKLNFSTGKVEQAPTTTDQDSSNETNANGSKSGTYSQRQVGSTEDQQDGDVLFDEISSHQRMMSILSNKIISPDGAWIVTGVSEDDMENTGVQSDTNSVCKDCKNNQKGSSKLVKESLDSSASIATEEAEHNSKFRSLKNSTKSSSKKGVSSLTCGKPVNSTQYDHLRGISERHQHSHVPEPDVAMVFKGSGEKSTDVDMAHLEQRLRKARKDVVEKGNPMSEQSAQVFNLIGNFWRIKGDTQKSIECFRKALNIVPQDPDILLNLARVLFNLQYLDDAIFLARKSLSHQPAEENSWLQHFTLGEILKSYGHPQEAVLHFHKAVDLNPSFQPAKAHLRDLAVDLHPNISHLTLFIIISLVVGVLLGLFMGTEAPKSQRHFNRAMAMRSIKLGINPRMYRLKKTHT